MTQVLRIATFNLENLDDFPGQLPTLQERIAVMRPQLVRMRADVLCLQEVHGQEPPAGARELSALATLLQGTPYENYHVAHTRTTAGQVYDKRNLVVVSRFPILGTEQYRHTWTAKPQYRRVTSVPADDEAKDISWERPLLYVTLDLGQNGTLHLITLHLKSKLPVDIPGQKEDRYTWRSAAAWAEGYFLASMKRVGQALEARVLIDRIFDAADAAGEQPLIAVCGDYNGEIDSVPVSAIRGQVEDTGNPALLHRIMLPCELSVAESSRYTLLHLGKGLMLDHILASRALMSFYHTTEIHNEAIPDESGAFRTDVKFPESDHAPVVAEYLLP